MSWCSTRDAGPARELEALKAFAEEAFADIELLAVDGAVPAGEATFDEEDS